MGDRPADRRRSRRVSVSTHTLSIKTSTRVRVLDIGAGGLLMMSSFQEIPEGLAVLRLPLAAGSFASVVQVRHQASSADAAGRFGAAFVDMNHQSRHNLERFLARTSG